ncbi:MAG: RagB/SusD family nutrient uptake outer membrane protein [Catalinimonas sp.]
MKTLRSILLSAVCLTTLLHTSCSEEFLDLPLRNNLTDDNYFTEPEHFEKAILSAYEILRWPQLYGLHFWYVYSHMSDNTKGEFPNYDRLEYNARDGSISEIYRGIYVGIFRTNLVLGRIEDVAMDEDLKQRIIAEAKVLRAIYYWHAANVFGISPLILRELAADEGAQPNSSPQAMYDQMVVDLTEALQANLLPDKGEMEIGRMTEWAARAFLGKVYLCRGSQFSAEYPGDFAAAAEQFELVINSGRYSLIRPSGADGEPSYEDYVNAYQSIFSPSGQNNNSESLFEIQHGSWTNGNAGGPFLGWMSNVSSRPNYLNFAPGGFDNMNPSQELVDAYEEEDPRLEVTVWQEGDILESRPDRSNNSFYLAPFEPSLTKWSNYAIKKDLFPIRYTAVPNDPNNWRFLRYSDVLLMYAEVIVLAGQDESRAFDLVNQVRDRVGLSPLTGDIRTAIMTERRREFAFEAKRIHDLQRYERNGWINSVTDFLPFYRKERHETLPLPQREIDLAGGILVQRPGY